MKDIQGKNNELVFTFPDKEMNCLTSTDAWLDRILEQADISIIGDNNRILLRFDSKKARKSC